mmetsp:Transcript_13400/g.35630  ORF Transcript_13400/g.35630 Transcript_13400/m.35630 type:complete len:491 (-) Transcript_13400:38-1510(-)
MRRYAGLWLAAAWAYDQHTGVDARIRRALKKSLEPYPKGESKDDAVHYLRDVLSFPESAVLVYDHHVIVDRRFLRQEKNRKHVNFLASIVAKQKSIKNAAYAFSGNSTGFCGRDMGAKRAPYPCLIIAKAYGAKQPGVLVPNPYHQDLDYWSALRDHIKARASSRPWKTRLPLVFWRGNVLDRWHAPDDPRYAGDSCENEFGNHARLAAMAESVLHPDLVDVKCFSKHKCRARDPDERPCPDEQYLYSDTMRRVQRNSSLITDHGHVAKENYTRYKYVLNLPGSTSGSYSRNLNHLWFLGSVVLFWKARFSEWYFPALTEGETHLTVDSSTLADAVRMLEENTKDARVLREKASDVDHRIMCPSCLAAYVSEVIDEVRAHFALSKLLDDPCATHAFFDALNCQRRDLVIIRATARPAGSFDVSEFMHRRLTTNTTFAKTTCHEIASRAHLQCRQRDRSILGWLRAKLGGWHAAQVPSLDEPPGTRRRLRG